MFLGLMPNLDPKGNIGTAAWQKISGRVLSGSKKLGYGNWPARSRTRNRKLVARSSRSMSRLRAGMAGAVISQQPA